MNEFDDIAAILDEMAEQLAAHVRKLGTDTPAMVGIHTGGVWVAERLHEKLKLSLPLGALNISFYRDDFSRKGFNPVVNPSVLPFSVDDRHILLVDDVLHTGRTIRAAMNELFDYGRPASISLIALAERNGRELPIEPQFCGQHFQLDADQHIQLHGPSPLRLEIL